MEEVDEVSAHFRPLAPNTIQNIATLLYLNLLKSGFLHGNYRPFPLSNQTNMMHKRKTSHPTKSR